MNAKHGTGLQSACVVVGVGGPNEMYICYMDMSTYKYNTPLSNRAGDKMLMGVVNAMRPHAHTNMRL